MNKIPVLIIDDNEADRYLLSRQLNDTNLEIHIFEKHDGASALEFLTDYEKNRTLYPDLFPPAIIFLDINMPLVNGWEFLDKFSVLRNEIAIDSCVVIMFTSSERQEDVDKVFSFDFVKDYLVKGKFTHEELENKIKSIMSETE